MRVALPTSILVSIGSRNKGKANSGRTAISQFSDFVHMGLWYWVHTCSSPQLSLSQNRQCPPAPEVQDVPHGGVCVSRVSPLRAFLRIFALAFLWSGLVRAVLTLSRAPFNASSRLDKSCRHAARQKKLLERPSSKSSIIVSRNAICFLCGAMNSWRPCSLMKA